MVKKNKAKASSKASISSPTAQSKSGTCCTTSTDLFKHLPAFYSVTSSSLKQTFDLNTIHPAIQKVGLKTSNKLLNRGRSRSIAMLEAFQQLISDHKVDPQQTLMSSLLKSITLSERFLDKCRPLAPAQLSILQYLKLYMSSLPQDEESSRAKLIEYCTHFIDTRIHVASDLIGEHIRSKLTQDDVILTYGASTTVLSALISASRMTKFKVIVVDSRPDEEGFRAVERLTKEGIETTFCLLTGLSFVISKVTKVILGVSAMLSNGSAFGLCGTATVALTAHASNIPVVVVCETYRFIEHCQLDSVTWNELGDPHDLVVADVPRPLSSTRPSEVTEGNIGGFATNDNLDILNLVYDVTPIHYIDVIVSEWGYIPPTAVPLVLREFKESAIF
ncbi:hypothetical protein P9112_000200 [Eukaryota sp. TZLM1-RC]